MIFRVLAAILCATLSLNRGVSLWAAEPISDDLFAQKNLVAWCIVPFDSKKRGPEERAAMLEKLGFSKFAYDYRAEHIPTFDAEIEALRRHQIELTAWWFPTSLNDEAKSTLSVFERHKVTPQLWVTGGGEPTKSPPEQRQRVLDEASRIRPIAEAAAKIGCKVALYNHGGWFGEPENQIAIIRELMLPNVGIVYNQHHGHDHLDRFPELLRAMMPYLLTLNLNGMVKDGERRGQKILQLGEGDLDLKLLRMVRDSGYTGPIGILGHTSDDAEERLRDNLDGLDWLRPQLQGKPAGPKPKMRTPVPIPNGHAAISPNVNVPRLAEGKFGQALDGKAGGAFVVGREEFRQFPITVECWTKLTDKAPYNILVAHELKTSGTHWELFTMAGTGNFTAYTPGFAPDHCHTQAMICDGKWHHVAMVLEPERIRLFVDGRQVAVQAVTRTETKSVSGNLALASLVDRGAGCTGFVDEVRISRGIRAITSSPAQPFEVDESTLGLWHLDELIEQKRFEDATGKNAAQVGMVSLNSASTISKLAKIEGHWGEDALGFRWTEDDSRDDRFGEMDTGPFFSGSITGPGGIVYKGIVVRVGSQRTHAICYDTEQMRASAGWTGFLKFDAARYGIIVPPRIDGEPTFTTPNLAGWTRSDQFTNHRATNRFGPLPKAEAHYEGLYRHGQRVVLKFTVGGHDPLCAPRDSPTVVLESPWLEEAYGVSVLSRTILVAPTSTPLSMLVADRTARIRLRASEGSATLQRGPEQSHILVVPAHSEPVTLKLLIAASAIDEAAFDKLAEASPAAEDLIAISKPGPTIWGEPLVTVGEIANSNAPYVIDTITLPFDNPFHALMFCGGHDFLPDGRAFVCTLHGDVWLVDGIDEKLERITWRRFATGLFQPLGLKVLSGPVGSRPSADSALFVVGRDQITRLHDFNGDGEADFYENFNNDAHVSLNGHEYVTCLETDRGGNFYFVKGNCDSATPHDGSLLRVSADGSQLSVYATGFRNSNGIGIAPNDEITVAPQEGEWTPASAVFAVREGGFYGAMMSHHRPTPPTDFERPFCWFPRLADNSCGGQVWVNSDRWGPFANRLLHLSYGQCKLRLLLKEELVDGDARRASPPALVPPETAPGNFQRTVATTMNGGSTEFPLTFASGVHRGRFNAQDGQLYVTGLKGWVSSAVNDGCFQRVRYTGQGIDLLVSMKTYRNGIALTFTRPLNREEAENIDNYELEAWNYHWSAEYGSPDFKPSASRQIGRDPVDPKSATLFPDNRTVFLELPDLTPVDQLGIGYTLRSADGATLEQTAYLTLNGVPNEVIPDDELHPTRQDPARSALIARLSPGVILTAPFLATPAKSRLMAWTDIGPTDEAQVLTATGYLKVPFTGDYRLNAAIDNGATLEIDDVGHPLGGSEVRRASEGSSSLEIDDAKHQRGGEDIVLRLRKGFAKIRVRHSVTRPTSGFRLMWESDRFPRELVPATALFHDTASDGNSDEREQFLTGRALFAKHQCDRCHIHEPGKSFVAPPNAIVESLRQAPQLDGIGSRVEPAWLAMWLRNPTRMRSHATMPSLLESKDDDALGDLVAYLVSLKELAENPQDQTERRAGADAQHLERGAVLYERLGCIACHTFSSSDTHEDWNRVSLQFASSKFRPGRLGRFLRDPHRYHVGSHMPNYHLSEDESGLLEVHIERNAKGICQPSEPLRAGNPHRGQKLFAEIRCDRCHQVSAGSKLGAADVRPALVLEVGRGCLDDVTDRLRSAPVFKWTDGERASLRTYLATMSHGSAAPDEGTGSRIPRMLASLRCTACHARDATPASLPEIVADEGSGKLPEAVPQLTWVGEKLQGPWIAKLLNGELRQKPRPWLTARMPSFPAYADIISRELAAEHGLPYFEPRTKEFDPDQIEVGRRLTLRDGGLDCRQCHGVGNERPRGDAATQIALGINFTLARERLRPEFALRQMLDPPRYDIGSRMPRFAPDLRTTAAKHIAGGNARMQFEAIEQYLWSLKIDD